MLSAPAAPARDRTAHDAAFAPLPPLNMGHAAPSADLIAEYAARVPAEYRVPEHMWEHLVNAIEYARDKKEHPVGGGPVILPVGHATPVAGRRSPSYCPFVNTAKYRGVLCVENAAYHETDDNGCEGDCGRTHEPCGHLSIYAFNSILSMYNSDTKIYLDVMSPYDAHAFFAHLKLFPRVRELFVTRNSGSGGQLQVDVFRDALLASGVTKLGLLFYYCVPMSILTCKPFERLAVSHVDTNDPLAVADAKIRTRELVIERASGNETIALCNALGPESGLETLEVDHLCSSTVHSGTLGDPVPERTDPFDAVLRAVQTTGLSSLILRECQLFEDAAKTLASLATQTLRHLEFSTYDLTPEVLEGLAPMVYTLESLSIPSHRLVLGEWLHNVGRFEGYSTAFEVALRTTKSLRRLTFRIADFATCDKMRFALANNTSITQLCILDTLNCRHDEHLLSEIFSENATLSTVEWKKIPGEGSFTCPGLVENAEAVEEKKRLRQRAAAMVFCWEQLRAAGQVTKVSLAHPPIDLINISAKYLINSWIVPRFRDGYRDDFRPLAAAAKRVCL